MKNAISTWDYGNGNVYFMSDVDGSFGVTSLVPYSEDIALSFMRGYCTYPNLSSLNIQKLANLNRYLSYDSDAIKMVVYVWT